MEPVELNVRKRLLALPAVARVPSKRLDLFILRNFVRPEECSHLIGQIELRRRPSQLMAPNGDPFFRTSDTCSFGARDPVIEEIEHRLLGILGIHRRFGEFIQGQRYECGQEFRPHHDFLREDQEYWKRQKAVGGQRTWTAMMFLNAPDSGGETYFPKIDLTIPPRPGSLVVWNNLNDNGQPNFDTLHQALPVRAGVKYIITKWYRKQPWGPKRGV